jgi:uncharacterized OB-fold protein
MSAYPLVQRDDSSSTFFDAAQRGQLQMRRSASGVMWPPQASTDPDDPSAWLQPVIVSGDATLVSWSVIHQAPHPALADAVPYVSAVVELAEGPWLIVRLLGDAGQLTAGAKVRVRFEPTGSGHQLGEVVPVFELA